MEFTRSLTSLCPIFLFCFMAELQTATLNIRPNKSQFFWYEPLSLSCMVTGNSSGWTLKRNTSNKIFEPCSPGWGVPKESSCTIEDAYPSDSGVYWCESEFGESSNIIDISITDGVVILEIPALPVTEGDRVTLYCQYKEEDNNEIFTNFSANFYKNGVFIGAAGNFTLVSVSKADEGFYKCEHPSKEESPQSWLAVNSKVRAQPPPVVTFLPKMVGVIILLILCKLMLVVFVNAYRKWSKD
ncbi:uncharacterized protein LOC113157141 [Anabas testudineus]|uniref:uncharacterized protein LOC113157141 n=1 Tax=Anabas testudineus TaxID=64144 RepID=UPI000E455C8B|nr:uncharacterized protein LOC113157141 [Anabas testudineus]